MNLTRKSPQGAHLRYLIGKLQKRRHRPSRSAGTQDKTRKMPSTPLKFDLGGLTGNKYILMITFERTTVTVTVTPPF